MSELKAYIAPTPDGTGLADYYLKSEVDKVIAEKDYEISKLKEQVQGERSAKVNYKISANDLSDGLKDAYEEIKHHKYKRCLAMAKWCESENYIACWYHENNERCKWTEKWHKRWLELAEKFKEDCK